VNKLFLENYAKVMKKSSQKWIIKHRGCSARPKEALESLEHECDNTIIIMTFQILTVVLLYLSHLGCCTMSA